MSMKQSNVESENYQRENGILAALDFHYGEAKGHFSEVEYQLLSTGELATQFAGDREHSLEARILLRDFPFKMFCVSQPTAECRQTLCVAFKCPSNTSAHEVGNEFAAFLSLLTRRRIFALKQTRCDGLPVEHQPRSFFDRSEGQLQSSTTIQQEEIALLLMTIQKLDAKTSSGFVLAMRLYHTAVSLILAEPQIAYLLLVMSIETISGVTENETNTVDEDWEQYLDSCYKGWRTHCDISTPELKASVVQMLTKSAYRTLRKFRSFIQINLPEKFWTETSDDGKPVWWSFVYDVNGRAVVENDRGIQPWEKWEPKDLKRILDAVYASRSKFVHEGAPFSAEIVLGLSPEIPFDAAVSMMNKMMNGSTNNPLTIPSLITFERMVNYSLMGFLRTRSSPEKG